VINLVNRIDLVEKILRDHRLTGRGPRWALNRIACALARIESCDPAALAFAGLPPDAELPGAGAELSSIDRLIERMGLTSIEIDLVLLAAMAEEHEGYASVLPSLNPRNEPYATAGLAAQLVKRSVARSVCNSARPSSGSGGQK
jgi:hypothetical protein